MRYREEQRTKAISKMESFFKDPGFGVFSGKQRDFVLSDSRVNLWEGVREDAIDYFRRNQISWWRGANDEPTGHLLSSQIACLNHLYPLRQRRDLATAVLSNIDPNIQESEFLDDGLVEFEFIGMSEYLNEGGWTRGANCTSIDAAMLGKDRSGEKKLFLIEWKYTEDYAIEDKYIPERASRYDGLIADEESPFSKPVDVRAFYFEPFYQLMRQTLLAWQCVRHGDYGVTDYVHVHVVPKDNHELRDRVTSPYLRGHDIHEAWRSTLKDPGKFVSITPEELLSPVKEKLYTKSFFNYLETRYWD